ncbi:MAG: hypothetical protein ACLUFN_07450 [Eubacterium sp.]
MIILIAAGIFSASISLSDSGEIFKDNPSYTVVNKWYDKDNKKIALNEFITDTEMLLHTEIPADDYNDAKLIIKTKNLSLCAHTSGKILYRSNNSKYACFGECYNIIDVSDIKDGSKIYLQLIPKRNMTGSITETVYLTTQNDFLMHLLSENKLIITVTATAFLLLIIYSLWSIQQMLKTKRAAAKHIYACCAIFLLIVIAVTKTNLSFFIFGSSAVNYIAMYSAYMLLPIPLLSCYSSVSKTRHKSICILQLLTAAYSLLRLALFLMIPAPLSKAVFISHLLLIITIITITAYIIQSTKAAIKKRLLK